MLLIEFCNGMFNKILMVLFDKWVKKKEELFFLVLILFGIRLI